MLLHQFSVTSTRYSQSLWTWCLAYHLFHLLAWYIFCTGLAGWTGYLIFFFMAVSMVNDPITNSCLAPCNMGAKVYSFECWVSIGIYMNHGWVLKIFHSSELIVLHGGVDDCTQTINVFLCWQYAISYLVLAIWEPNSMPQSVLTTVTITLGYINFTLEMSLTLLVPGGCLWLHSNH